MMDHIPDPKKQREDTPKEMAPALVLPESMKKFPTVLESVVA